MRRARTAEAIDVAPTAPGRTPRSRAAIILTAVVLLSLTGCAVPGTRGESPITPASPSPAPTASGTPTDAAGARLPTPSARRWMLVKLADDQGTVQNPSPVPTLDLLDGATASGTDGCNSFSGRIRAGSDAADSSGTSVSISNLVSTLRACTTSNGVESRYLAALESVDRLSVVGDRLTLSSAEVTLTFDIDRMVTIQPVQPNDP